MPDPSGSDPSTDPTVARDLELLREGDRLLAAGEPRAALPLFASIGDGPLAAYAGLRRGRTLHALGEPELARAALQRAAELKPGDAPILFALANLDRDQGRWDDAQSGYREAMRVNPGAVEPPVNLAGMLRHLGRLDAARAVLADALARRGDAAVLHDALGQVELAGGDTRAAELAFRRAIAIDPSRATTQANLAEALADLGRWPEAVDLLDRAIPQLAQPGQARLNRAYALMALGDWRRAWIDYESRFDRPAMAKAPRRPEHFALRRWSGEPLDGRLFVWGEQGLGDEILCASQFATARTRCGGLTIEAEPRLADLFARSFPQARVVARAPVPPVEDCAAQIAAGSMMGLLGWTPDRAAPRAFLRPDPAAVAAAAARHRKPGRRLVGLSWASGAGRLGVRKSLPIDALCRLVAGIDAEFLDLQYGDTGATRAALRAATGVELRHDPDIDLRQDIDGLAALAAACDTVVTTSNVTAHVAGAIGADTHVLLPGGQALFWYWLDVDGRSAFYPRATLHRQERDDWGPAIDAACAALAVPAVPP
ncbi:MAG: tetratricopeptide repeat protein [Rhodospirillales bacterium]|jgi:tetratricopeptide (TPR) repeat protein